MSHWSKLKRDLENLMSPDIDFNIYCNSYRIGEATPIPRFWVTIDKYIVWDWPHDFKSEDGWYFYEAAKRISQLIRDYINTSRNDIFTTEFDDRFHLVPLLQTCDARVGKRTLTKLLGVNVKKWLLKISQRYLTLRDETMASIKNDIPRRNHGEF